jgi:hypothetical protein
MNDDKLNIKSLTRKKLYDKYLNNYEFFNVDKKLPLDIKSRIPHWVPTKNSDIFEVRKVMVKEKEIEKNLNRSVGTYKIENEILISKKIAEEESKKLGQRLNRDLSLKIIQEESNKNTHRRNYITESRYQDISKYNLKDTMNTKKFDKKSNNNISVFSESIKDNISIKNLSVISNKKSLKSFKKEGEKIEKKVKIINEYDSEKDKEKKKKNKAVLITETNIMIPYESMTEEEKDNFLENLKIRQRFKTNVEILDVLKEEKDKEEDENQDNKTEILLEKQNINQSKTSNLIKSTEVPESKFRSNKLSTREYLDKTREIVLLRNSIQLKKENALRIEEEYKNQLESVRDSIISLEQLKKLFEEEFFSRFEKYVKYLNIQKDKELYDLSQLLDDKSQIELDIAKLENRKVKAAQKVNLYREYRDFLICVKERCISVPEFFQKCENFKNNISINIELYKKNRNYNESFDNSISWEGGDEESKAQWEHKTKLSRARSNLMKELNTPTEQSIINNSPRKETENIAKKSSSGSIIKNGLANNLPIKKTLTNVSGATEKLGASSNNNFNNSIILKQVFKIGNHNEVNRDIKVINERNKITLDPILKDVDFSLLDRYNKYIKKYIYENPNDLNEDIKKMQTENINLLKKLANTSSKVNLFNLDLQKLIKAEGNISKKLKNELDIREDFVRNLRENNKNLHEEKNFISDPRQSIIITKYDENFKQNEKLIRKSLIKSKFSQAIVYSKINEIFNTIKNMKINEKINKDINIGIVTSNNIQKKKDEKSKDFDDNKNEGQIKKGPIIDKESNMIYMLKILEKSIDFLVLKVEEYKNHPIKNGLLENIRIDLEKERKIKKSMDIRLKDEKRRDLLNSEIIERNNRGVILPRRKIVEKFKPIEKIKTNSLLKSNKEKESNIKLEV